MPLVIWFHPFHLIPHVRKFFMANGFDEATLAHYVFNCIDYMTEGMVINPDRINKEIIELTMVAFPDHSLSRPEIQAHLYVLTEWFIIQLTAYFISYGRAFPGLVNYNSLNAHMCHNGLHGNFIALQLFD